MRNVTDRTKNPFGMEPSCSQFVPGYGDANADFHVIGDHPGVHGGVETQIPFTDVDWAETLQQTLVDAGLLLSTGDEPTMQNTFFSYLHMCVPTEEPTEAQYHDMERFFDAELRAIAAHVLLPVGARATKHVLEQYSAQAWKTEIDMTALHGKEIRGSGFLILPIKDPAEWVDGDAERLRTSIQTLRSTDYRRETDLGRFIAGSDPYFVR
ncbi:uracil-DNA glycosylase family protein [Natronocalculus amylovorans]|uniref:Uracil-DNA glycosylase n=1 Tax=Natronocalculus amylovorans TaxID=2917812 RepID=A0AAE3FXU6_9EURY|nr:uracil-DNA glycosylase family protein [Natronocalculus amylovorans]MCL9817373.1 uracil-DNA glycosylase [Natronocalculus amylovorans]